MISIGTFRTNNVLIRLHTLVSGTQHYFHLINIDAAKHVNNMDALRPWVVFNCFVYTSRKEAIMKFSVELPDRLSAPVLPYPSPQQATRRNCEYIAPPIPGWVCETTP